MGRYSGTPDNPQRTKAVLGVAAVHAGLAAIILSGLNVHAVRRAVETMTTFDVTQPPPPPVPPARPAPKAEKPKHDEGAAAKKAEPKEIAAPKSPVPPANPLPAAPVAGAGKAAKSGAAASGNGTGAGGTGTGRGGGGMGDTSRFTPARLTRNLNRADYAALASGRMPVGSADAAIAIAANGSVAECRLLRSSGDRDIDSRLCPVLVRRLRFDPARDAEGRAIGYRTNYRANWRLGD